MITISIDLTKVDKSKIVEGKNGQKYYNITVDRLMQPDKFGNTHTVYQSQSKDERAAKVQKVYLGNGKEWVFEQKNSTPAASQMPEPEPEMPTWDDGLPF